LQGDDHAQRHVARRLHRTETLGWPHNLSDEQILERPLALNVQRAAGQR
jgi:hypothetical protein